MSGKSWMLMVGMAGTMLAARPAGACGCFTPPDPTVPVVQAGERILFSIDSGQVTAHIQIQYKGEAAEFGWLLPLPSVPKLELGTDELFNQLITTTQPKYRMNRVYNGNCYGGLQGRGAGAPQTNSFGGGSEDAEAKGNSPVLIQASVGPYDYAVLKGDSKQEMLDWLATNRYFVPVGTDDVVAPYVHPGAYFLALKLRPGATVGDLQPVVVHYASDLAMIPIVLSSVAAAPDMGIQVWMLGDGRAIPRNYYHTVVNDAAIDWGTAGQNYNDVVIRATKEAPGRHTFVTEYAGTTQPMKKVLNPDGRFGQASELQNIHDPVLFTQYMSQHGWTWSSQVVSIVQHYIPFPAGISAMGIPAAQYYQSLQFWLGEYRRTHPKVFERYTFHDDPVSLTEELFERVAAPTLAAGALFDKAPYLTRLYTTLSPENMDRDPVFSYNPDLPGVANVHEATLTYECGFFGSDPSDAYTWLKTEDGFAFAYDPNAKDHPLLGKLPASRRIEVLREAGVPEVQTDNTKTIQGDLGQGGCAAAPGDVRRNFLGSLGILAGLALLMARSLRRRSVSSRGPSTSGRKEGASR